MDRCDYITSGEVLKCSCGTEKTELKVAVKRTITIDDKRIATMVDSLPDVNIECFGQCKADQNTLAPYVFEGFWVDGCKRVIVDGFPALTKNSALICTRGQGVIVPRDNEIVEIDQSGTSSEKIKVPTVKSGEFNEWFNSYVYTKIE